MSVLWPSCLSPSLKSLPFKFFLKMYLFESKADTEKGRDTKRVSHFLAHSLNAHNSWIKPRSKPGDRNSICTLHMGDQDMSSWGRHLLPPQHISKKLNQKHSFWTQAMHSHVRYIGTPNDSLSCHTTTPPLHPSFLCLPLPQEWQNGVDQETLTSVL